MQIHSLNITQQKVPLQTQQSGTSGDCQRQEQPSYNIQACVQSHGESSFLALSVPGAHSLHAPLSNLGATMRSSAGDKESKNITKAKPPTSPPLLQPVATSEKKLGVDFKSPYSKLEAQVLLPVKH